MERRKPWQELLLAAQQAAATADVCALQEACDALTNTWGEQAEALLDLAAVFVAAGNLTKAEDVMRWCHQIAPQDVRCLITLANIWLQTLRQKESIELYQKLPISSGQLVALAYHPEATTALHKHWAEAWGQTAQQQHKATARVLDPYPRDHVYRIGWLSGDLCQHPVGLFLWPLVDHLRKKTGIEMVFYDTQPREDWLQQQLKRCGSWHIVAGHTQTEIADQIRNDQLSILIELSGHTAGNRLPVLIHRPAPIQWSWLGYWGTTGLTKGVDAVVVDTYVVPRFSETEAAFMEPLLDLPQSRWCYRPVPWMPPVTPPPCLAKGWVTFGSLNSSTKLNPDLLQCWAELLRRVPHSRLLLKNYQFRDENLQTAIRYHFNKYGVDKDRLILQGPSVHVELLAVYAEIDIALDPYPFNGGLTSCEALWLGLPLVTLAGRDKASMMAGHQGEAVLRLIGRSEWITYSQDQYLQVAEQLAHNPQELLQIRQTQRSSMQASALCNEKAFADDFLDLVMRACEGVHSTRANF